MTGYTVSCDYLKASKSIDTLIEGSNPFAYVSHRSVMTTITEGQVLALNQTPVKVVEPAGADLGVVIDNVVLYKAAGSSYVLGDATDISIGNLAGDVLTTLQSALGLLGPAGAAVGMLLSAGKSLIPVANEGLYLKLAGGNVTGQGSGLIALINYKIIPTKLS